MGTDIYTMETQNLPAPGGVPTPGISIYGYEFSRWTIYALVIVCALLIILYMRGYLTSSKTETKKGGKKKKNSSNSGDSNGDDDDSDDEDEPEPVEKDKKKIAQEVDKLVHMLQD